MKEDYEIILDQSPIDEAKNLDFVKISSAGGLCQFVGIVRDFSKGNKVKYLEFEAYIPMAKKEIEKIINRVFEDFSLKKVSVHHALGRRNVGEVCVAISVSSAHRKDCFIACQFIIDELKRTVPIWKKEFYDGGSVWVSAHP